MTMLRLCRRPHSNLRLRTMKGEYCGLQIDETETCFFSLLLFFPCFCELCLNPCCSGGFPSRYMIGNTNQSSLSACGHKKPRDVATYITRDVYFISTNNSIGNIIIQGLSYRLFVVIIGRAIKVTIPNVYCGFYSIGNDSLLFVVQVVCSLKHTYFPHYFRLQTKSPYM